MYTNLNFIYKILIFLSASVITALLFPWSNKFSYEFQKGEPWKHENLIAEYDFPVYKSDELIKIERDSILKFARPYFTYNRDIINTVEIKLNDDFKKSTEKLTETISDKKLIELIKVNSNKIRIILLNELHLIYEKGIIEPVNEKEKTVSNNSDIYIVKENVAELVLMSSLYTQKKAYIELNKTYSDLKAQSKLPLPEIDFSEYVFFNVSYNRLMSEKATEQLLKELSPVRGMIQAGERIIYEGQLINDEKFQILTSLKKQYISEQKSYSDKLVLFFGELIIATSIFAILFLYLFFYNKKIFDDNRKLLYFPFMMILMIILTAIVSKHQRVDIYIVPVTILPLITATFYKPRTAFLHHVVTILLTGFIVANGFEYIFIQFIAGFVAISGISKLNNRSEVLWTALMIFISYLILYIAFTIIKEGEIEKIDLNKFAWFAGSSILVIMAYPLIYFIEKVFGFISDVTLIELSDTNRPLLKLLAEKAPGTFQHSVQVANISESAAREIEANPLLVRAGALYHDIGKMNNPSFYIENQHSDNPHDKISPQKSIEIIKQHVSEGIKIAKKYSLPKDVSDFILTHHGNAKITWFLFKYKEAHKDEKIDEEKFRYNGILPYSKETAVVMIVDSVEAASRSLTEYTESSIDNLIEKIVQSKIKDNLLIHTDITFDDINKIKKILKTKLRNIYHTRVVYPE